MDMSLPASCSSMLSARRLGLLWHKKASAMAKESWRHGVRAEMHYKLVLFGRYWVIWRHYVMAKRRKKSAMAMAVKLWSENTLKLTLHGWKLYAVRRVEIRKAKKIADAIVIRRRTKCTIARWKEALMTSRHVRDLLAHANTFRHRRLLMDYVTRWSRRFNVIMAVKERQAAAEVFYNRLLVLRGIRAWWRYVEERRCKTAKYVTAREFRIRYALKLVVVRWHLHSRRRNAQANRDAAAIAHWNHCILKRAFAAFVAVVQHQRVVKARFSAAAGHHDVALQIRTMRSFKNLLAVKKQFKEADVMALKWHDKRLVTAVIQRWRDHRECKEERRLIPQLQYASHYRQQVVQVSAFSAWKAYVLWRRRVHVNTSRALHHATVTIMQRYWQKWRAYVLMAHKKADMAIEATDFRHRAVLVNSLDLWRCEVTRRTLSRSREERAISLSRISLLRRYIRAWHAITAENIYLSDQMDKAVIWRNRRLASCAFATWKYFTIESVLYAAQWRQAVRHYYFQSLVKAMRAFRLFILNARKEHLALSGAAEFHSQKAISHAFRLWRLVTVNRLQERSNAMLADSARHRWLLRRGWYAWSKRYVRECQGTEGAKATLLRLVRHSWAVWQKSVIESRIIRQSDDIRVNVARKHMTHWMGRRVLWAWADIARSEARKRHQEKRAYAFYRITLARRSFVQWKAYVMIRINKNIARSRADNHYNTRSMAVFLELWREAYVRHALERFQTRLSLHRWSFSLRYAAFTAWKSYVMFRRVKRERVAASLRSRRERLLRRGVSQWLVAAGTLSSERIKVAAERKMFNTLHLYATVAKFARRWRWRTRSALRARERRRLTVLKDPIEIVSGKRTCVGEHSDVEASDIRNRVYAATFEASVLDRRLRADPASLIDRPRIHKVSRVEESSSLNYMESPHCRPPPRTFDLSVGPPEMERPERSVADTITATLFGPDPHVATLMRPMRPPPRRPILLANEVKSKSVSSRGTDICKNPPSTCLTATSSELRVLQAAMAGFQKLRSRENELQQKQCILRARLVEAMSEDRDDDDDSGKSELVDTIASELNKTLRQLAVATEQWENCKPKLRSTAAHLEELLSRE